MYHIQTSRCIEASNSIRKKEAPNNSKYKLPLAVRTLVIYFCWGGILIVKWKGLCDFFSQNYLRIFSLLLLSSYVDVQSQDWEFFSFQFLVCQLVSCILGYSRIRNCFCWLFLIGESVLFKCSVTCVNICTQSESTKWSRELFLQMCLLVRKRSAYLELKSSFFRQMCLSVRMYSAYLERKSSFFRVFFRWAKD